MYSKIVCVVFFFKQKTAYEMRISDWSSDVCSSDLPECHNAAYGDGERHKKPAPKITVGGKQAEADAPVPHHDQIEKGQNFDKAPLRKAEIGRASCRERVCPYV